jgi:hypothetical protein
MWCVAWWHSGREDEDEEEDEDEGGCQESSRTAAGYDDTLTPVSLETPVASVMSRCDSFGVVQSTSLNLDRLEQQEYVRPSALRTSGAAGAATITGKNMTNDSVRARPLINP